MSTTLAGAFAQGVDASKPAASSALEGYCYFSTDINGGTLYQCKSSAWVQLTAGVSALKANGLTGATAASRYAGGTTSGAPASGTFAVGDFVIDHAGAVWVCTVAGTPGTWVSASGAGVTSISGTANEVIASASTGAVTLSTPQAIGTASSPTFATIAAGGITGAVAASRYAGAVASGAPASGTFLLGDFTIDQTGKIWVCTVAGSPGTWTQIGGTGGGTDYILIQDQKSSGTDGGTFTSGAWQQRDLNTIVSDAGGHSSLSSNQIILAAGTYRFRIYCPAYAVNEHQARLYNVTDSAVIALGQSADASPTAAAVTVSIILGRFTISGTKTLAVQHQCLTTAASDGFGVSNAFGTQVYTSCEFEKE